MTRILAPRDLDSKGQEQFRDFLAQCRQQGTWVDTDQELLGNVCRQWMVARHAMARVTAREKDEPGTGWQTLGAQRQLVQHPDVRTWKESGAAALAGMKELILTPATRRAAQIDAAPTGDDPLASL